MEIISLQFALLAIISGFLYYIVDPKFRVIYLIVLSAAFICTLSIGLILYVVLYSVFNYFIGIYINISNSKNLFFRIGLIANVLQLIILRYLPVHNEIIGLNLSIIHEIILPFGVSYFTLQGIGYLYNIKIGRENPEKSFQNFLLYIIFYPKFVAGPIERSDHFLNQLKRKQDFTSQRTNEGLQLVLIGFFKVVVISQQLGFYVNNVYSDLSTVGGFNLWLVVIIQPFYLYFDFSGYTDIALGLAKTYGIALLPNFNKPYLSQNVTSFWKNFHISLSTWFKDYIFLPVAYRYRRFGNYASIFAVLLTFMLFGVWHGSGWNFFFLGFLQASAIIFEYLTKKLRLKIFSLLPHFFRVWLGRLITISFFGMSLVFFFSPDLDTALNFISKLDNLKQSAGLSPEISLKFLFISLFSSLIFYVSEIIAKDHKTISFVFEKLWGKTEYLKWLVYYIALVLILLQIDSGQKFIYSNF